MHGVAAKCKCTVWGVVGILLLLVLVDGCTSGRYGCFSGRYETWTPLHLQYQDGELSCILHYEKQLAPFMGIFGRGMVPSETVRDAWFMVSVQPERDPKSSDRCRIVPLDWTEPENGNCWSLTDAALIDDRTAWRLSWGGDGLSSLNGDVIETSLETGRKTVHPGPDGGIGFNGHPGGIGPMYCIDGTRLLYWDLDRTVWVQLDGPADFREIGDRKKLREDLLVSRDGSRFVAVVTLKPSGHALYSVDLASGQETEVPLAPPAPAILTDWDADPATGDGVVLLWEDFGNRGGGSMEHIVSTPAGDILARRKFPKSLHLSHWSHVDAKHRCVYGTLYPAGCPDHQGMVGDSSVAHGKYPSSLYLWNWETDEFLTFDLPQVRDAHN